MPRREFDPDSHFVVEGQADLPGSSSDAGYRVLSADYFRVLQIRLLHGRFFTKADTTTSPSVIIINASLAKRLWPHGNALGHRLWFGSFDPEKKWLTVVGIVDNVREEGPSIAAPGIGYVCYTQQPDWLMDTSLIVRSRGNLASLAPAIRKQIHAVSKAVPSASKPWTASLQPQSHINASKSNFSASWLGSPCS